MDDNNEILNNNNDSGSGNKESRISLNAMGTPPGEDKLLAYLEGKLLPEEQHEIEKWLSEENMEGDALEGLKLLPASETKSTINKLNNNLDRTLRHKKRKSKKAAPDQTILVAVIIILLLSVTAFVLIKLAAHK